MENLNIEIRRRCWKHILSDFPLNNGMSHECFCCFCNEIRFNINKNFTESITSRIYTDIQIKINEKRKLKN